jgi:hypothetical protein
LHVCSLLVRSFVRSLLQSHTSPVRSFLERHTMQAPAPPRVRPMSPDTPATNVRTMRAASKRVPEARQSTTVHQASDKRPRLKQEPASRQNLPKRSAPQPHIEPSQACHTTEADLSHPSSATSTGQCHTHTIQYEAIPPRMMRSSKRPIEASQITTEQQARDKHPKRKQELARPPKRRQQSASPESTQKPK